MSKRKQRRKRRLINYLARRHKFIECRFVKMFLANKVAIPYTGEGGWGFENGLLTDEGGKISLLFWNKMSLASAKDFYSSYEGFDHLLDAKKIRQSTKDPIVSRWPETMVRLNWSDELVPLESIRHRLKES